MRIGLLTLLLCSTAAAATLLTSCASSTLNANQGQTGGPGTNPAKSNPVITWSQPAAMSNSTPLGSAQLNATANVGGTFVYTPAAGAILAPGSHTLSVAFTPSDAADYNSATASVTLTVNSPNKPVASSNCNSGLSNGGADFLYVSAGAWNSGTYRIEGFAPNPDGSLPAVPGSPFSTPGPTTLSTVGAGSMLFGTDQYNLYSYGVHADGCLSLENSAVLAQGPEDNPSAFPYQLSLSPKGSYLYTHNFVPAEESYFASLSIDANTGGVTVLDNTATSMTNDGGQLTFDAKGDFAVSSTCTTRGGMGVLVFQVGGDGTLSQTAKAGANAPDVGPTNAFCPEGAASDHAGHFVIAGSTCVDPGPCESFLPYQLAVFNMDSTGTMTTNSTAQNMPVLDAMDIEGGVSSYQFSPDDRYLAVTGYTGLEVFAWDSTNAVLTHVATVKNTEGSCSSSSGCTGNGFGNVAWDSNDHLYTFLGNQLFVYTVTDAGITQAPGSPHTLDTPQWLTVVSARPQ
jgi:hypothetical protein